MSKHGYIVLSNLPKTSLKIDDVEVELQGGFRGFDAVPPGKHKLVWEREPMKPLVSYVELLPNDVVVCQMQYDGSNPINLLKLESPEGNRYRQLALSGAMGFTLWTYPKVWQTITKPSLIEAIINQGNRLKFVLKDDYSLSAEAIQSLRIAPNVVEFCTEECNFAFKLCPYAGDRFMLYVFVPSPEYPDCYDQKLDPALWGSLYNIIDDWGDFD